MPRTPLASTARVCCAAIPAALLCACAGGQGGGAGNASTRLTPDDFRAPAQEHAAADARTGDASPDAPDAADESVEVRASLIDPGAAEVRRVDARTARGGVEGVEVLSGAPELTETWLLSISDEAARRRDAQQDDGLVQAYPIDALVGHINGRPLFASEFFDQMDARLRSEAQRMTAQEWLASAREQIGLALRDRIRDELLLAELEASLSSDERLGLLGLMQQVRTTIVSQNFGSSALADTRFREEEGVSLDEKVRQLRHRELVRMQLQRALGGRAFVSWREVRQAYERDAERFSPPPVATLRMIWTGVGDDEKAREIGERLAAGEPFGALASDREFNAYRSADGGVQRVALDRDDPDATRFFAPDALNDVARALEVGEVAGPFDYNGRFAWMTLESVFDASVPLYDVQLTLHNELLEQRFAEIQARYFARLIDRGSLSDIAAMERRLFELAAERYLVAEGRVDRR